MPNEGRGDLEGDLGWMLGVVFRGYIKAAERALHDLPGGPRAYQVLSAAMADPPRNQGAIAEGLGIDRTVLTYLIDDLERLDLVVRRPDPADRRSRLVVATAHGGRTWQRYRDALRHIEEGVLDPLTEADATVFRSLMHRLAGRAQTRDPLTNVCDAADDLHARERRRRDPAAG